MSGEGEENLGFISDRRTSDSLPTFDLSKFPQKFVAEIIRYCYTDVVPPLSFAPCALLVIMFVA